jgi:hypothetical protein
MSEKLKFCKDCIWVNPGLLGYLTPNCGNLKVRGKPDLVTGIRETVPCREARYSSKLCGTRGKHFSQKEDSQ